MKHSLKLAALAACIGATALTSQAQSNTNIVADLGIHLTIMSQGVAITNGSNVIQNADVARLGTRDVINMLGTVTSNDFSSHAQLLRVTPIIDGTNGPTSTVIKDGTNVVDVSGFFAFATDGTAVSNSYSHDGKVLTANRYAIRSLALEDQAGYPALATHFHVQGFVVSTLHRVVMKDGLDVHGHYASWTVNGTGDHNTKPAVVEGEVTVSFDKVDTTGGL